MMQDVLTLQDQIYGDLLAALHLTPNAEERARAATSSTTNVEAYDLYLKGRSALRNLQDVESLKAALASFQQALSKDAGFALAYVGLSDANMAIYRITKDSLWAQKALAYGEQAQRLNDQLPEVCLSLGSAYNATGKRSEAIVILKRALELAPNSDDGYRRLGAVYVATSQKDEAIKAYEKAIEINPYYWYNYSVLGLAYYDMGKFEEALKAYRRVVELEPDNDWGHWNVGVALFSQGKFNECIAPFQKALQIKPSGPVYSNLGTAYFYLKRYTEAVRMFEKAAEMSPNEEMVFGNLADAYRWSAQPEKAAAAYDKAISLAYKQLEVNPRDANVLSSLALYYAKKGDAARASDFIRRARSIDKANVDFMYSQAVVDTLAGRNQDAIRSLRAALEKGYGLTNALGDPELTKLAALPEFKRLEADFSSNRSNQK